MATMQSTERNRWTTGPDQASKPHVLVLTGPASERLYERFGRLYEQSIDVVVVRDRRQAERRRSQLPAAEERRLGDRRVRPPEWVFPPETA
jgi:hypothetical protein